MQLPIHGVEGYAKIIIEISLMIHWHLITTPMISWGLVIQQTIHL